MATVSKYINKILRFSQRMPKAFGLTPERVLLPSVCLNLNTKGSLTCIGLSERRMNLQITQCHQLDFITTKTTTHTVGKSIEWIMHNSWNVYTNSFDRIKLPATWLGLYAQYGRAETRGASLSSRLLRTCEPPAKYARRSLKLFWDCLTKSCSCSLSSITGSHPLPSSKIYNIVSVRECRCIL